MFDFDITQGTLFEKDGIQYAVIKNYSWISGNKETGQYYVQVKMCIPANTSKLDEWVKFDPSFFCTINKISGR